MRRRVVPSSGGSLLGTLQNKSLARERDLWNRREDVTAGRPLLVGAATLFTFLLGGIMVSLRVISQFEVHNKYTALML